MSYYDELKSPHWTECDLCGKKHKFNVRKGRVSTCKKRTVEPVIGKLKIEGFGAELSAWRNFKRAARKNPALPHQ